MKGGIVYVMVRHVVGGGVVGGAVPSLCMVS